MRKAQSLCAAALFALLAACNQNPPAPQQVPAPTPSDAQAEPSGGDGEGAYIASVEISDAGPVIRDPSTTTYLVERRKDGDLFPVFLTKTVTKVVGGKKTVEGPFSLTGEAADKAIDLMEKIGALKETEYKPAQAFVGAGPKTFTVKSSDGSTARTITVLGGSTPDASLTGLLELAASEATDFVESKKGMVGKVAAFLEGKVWQSDSDEGRRISFREGRMVTWQGEKEDEARPYTSIRRWCADGCGRFAKKDIGEGMKAGYICCITLTAQDDQCLIVLEASGNKLELAGTGADDRSETFTHLVRK